MMVNSCLLVSFACLCVKICAMPMESVPGHGLATVKEGDGDSSEASSENGNKLDDVESVLQVPASPTDSPENGQEQVQEPGLELKQDPTKGRPFRLMRIFGSSGNEAAKNPPIDEQLESLKEKVAQELGIDWIPDSKLCQGYYPCIESKNKLLIAVREGVGYYKGSIVSLDAKRQQLVLNEDQDAIRRQRKNAARVDLARGKEMSSDKQAIFSRQKRIWIATSSIIIQGKKSPEYEGHVIRPLDDNTWALVTPPSPHYELFYEGEIAGYLPDGYYSERNKAMLRNKKGSGRSWVARGHSIYKNGVALDKFTSQDGKLSNSQ